MNNQAVYYGTESLSYLQNRVGNFISKRIFLLRGKKSYVECGAQEILEKIFSNNHIEVIEWKDFSENPKIEDVEKGTSILQDSGAPLIIAIGGGSVIDMAKLIRYAFSYRGDIITGDVTKTKELIPLIALPTTAGTGCESTPFAVCYKDHVKYSVEHPDILPDCALIYPPFTYKNSPYLTACTGFDALAQAIEAYWNVNATPESDGYAEKAIYTLWNNLPIVVNNPTETARINMSRAANLAGKAIAITRTTAPHAFSYAFTSYCGYPHGHAVALTFPFFFSLNILEKEEATLQASLNKDSYMEKMNRLRHILGLETCRDCQQYMRDYINCIHLTNNGLGGHDMNTLLSLVNIQRLQNNPVVMNQTIINKLTLFLE